MMVLTTWISTIFLILSTIVFVAYIYMTRHFSYWKKRGVPYLKPLPFLGNLKEIALLQVPGAMGIKNLYNAMDAPYFGIFVFDHPALMLKCPKMIHEVLIKNSYLFQDRTVANPDHNNINTNILVFQRNPKWKETRTKLSPVFSPAKLRGMFVLIDELCPKLVERFARDKIIDIKTVLDEFISDISARCFFGITTDCVDNKDSVFMNVYRRVFRFTLRNALIHSGYFFKPDLIDFLRIDFFKPDVTEYFSNLFLDTLNKRDKPQGKAIDLIDILKEMETEIKKKGKKLTKEDTEEMIAVALTFILAGIGTVSANLAFTFYELATHQDIQDRMRKEIKDNVEKYGGITYEGIQEMKFIELCTSETIRKYPLVPHVCRKAANSFTFANANLTIEKGTWVYIPVYGLQMDEKYFANPEDYNPDRFQDFKKKEGEIYFLPFGEGPRSCLGERFAIVVAKLVLAYTLLNFKLEKCDSTPEKVELEIKCFNLLPKDQLDIKISALN